MSAAILAFLNTLAGLVQKAGPAFLAFMAGKAHERGKQERAVHEETKRELEAERKAGDIMADPNARQRMRERWGDSEQ